MGPICRHCDQRLSHSLIDLGTSPPCNTLVTTEGLVQPETYYPLHAMVCSECFLVQVGDSVTPDDIFDEYAYFSSYSDTWVEHARRYVEDVVSRFSLNSQHQVFEVASNDGYLLQHFLPLGIPVVGIEPAKNIAQAARKKGIDTISEFLGTKTASQIVKQRGRAKLVVANNVLAHTPFLNDFVAGLATLLDDEGIVTIEVPHLLHLLELNQFDTIYHEHFSYFSFHTACRILKSVGLYVFDVESLSTHGGSLRIFACKTPRLYAETQAVEKLHQLEAKSGLKKLDRYNNFPQQVHKVKRDLLNFLTKAKEDGHAVVGYGAPGKGNTLLNYCGIRTDLLDYLVDRNPYKQGKFSPGARIPIYSPEVILETKPKFVLVLVWNLLDEVVAQMQNIEEWGGKFVVAIPELKIVD